MPQTLNGIGTHYYGKKNVQSEYGICEACQHEGLLESYETGYYFVILFIPFIPLGRKQIIDHCPHCSQHRSLSVADWASAKQQALESSSAALSQQMDDPAAAIHHLHALSTFQQMDEARDLATAIESSHAQNIDVQLALGAWHEGRGQAHDSNRCFDNAYQIDPQHLGSARAKGIGLLEQGKSVEAKTVLQPFFPPGENYDPAVCHALALSFQSQGDSETAREIFNQMLEASPELAKDKSFRKTVRAAEKASSIASSTPSALPRQSILRSPLFLWGLAAKVVICAVLGFGLYQANHRDLYIVNQSRFGIEIKIDNGERLAISANSRKTIDMAEGIHEIQVVSPTTLDAESFTISGTWYTRFFGSPIHILDPSHTAIVAWEETEYTEFAKSARRDSFKLSFGKLYVQFPHIDYPFKEFPESLRLEENEDRIKTRVSAQPLAPEIFLMELDGRPSTEEMFEIVERMFEITPNRFSLVSTYVVLGTQHNQEARCIEFLENRLLDRPIDIDVHRAYQSLAETAGNLTTRQLRSKYDTWLTQAPNNSALNYLRSRLETNLSDAVPQLEQVLEAEPEYFYARARLGSLYFSQGDFDRATQEFQQCGQRIRNDPILYDSYTNLLFATEKYRQLRIDLQQTTMRDDFISSNYLLQKIEILLCEGEDQKVDQLSDQARSAFAGDQNPSELARFNLGLGLLTNKFKFANRALKKIKLAVERNFLEFQVALTRGNHEDAQNALQQFGYASEENLALLAAAYQRAGQSDKASQLLDKVISQLKQQGETERKLAKMLRKAQSGNVQSADFLDLSISVDAKRKFLVAILCFSEIPSPKLISLSDRFNYRRQFPYHFVQRTVDGLKKEFWPKKNWTNAN